MDLKLLEHDYMVFGLFLIVGFVIREIIKPLQKLFIPSSVIGGLVALILGQQVLGWISIPESFQSVSSITINIILASMIFGIEFNKDTVKGFLDFTTLNMIGYSAQLALGTIFGSILAGIWTDLPQGWGTMGLFAFFGGHGVVAIAGEGFNEIGVPENMGLGMILATFGLIAAMTIGMIIVNWGIRKGYAKRLFTNKDSEKPQTGGILAIEKQESIGNIKTPSVSVNGLALQFSILVLSMFVGYKLLDILSILIPQLGMFPNTTRSMIGAGIVWIILVKTGKKDYVDKKTMSTISSFALEFTILCAIATLRLDLLSKFIIPILIYTIIMLALMLFISFVIAPRISKVDWFEKMIMNFGQSLGDTAAGYALLRCVDPGLMSTAPESLGIASSLTVPITGLFPVIIPYLVMRSPNVVTGIGVGMTIACLLIFRIFFYNKSQL